MAQSKITLIGMERFLNPERSVFDELLLPEGIDKEILVGSILMRCQEFELLYSDPEFMTAAVNVWGRKHYWTFDKWIKVMNKEYEPLWNKDFTEEISDTHEGEYSKEGTGSSSGNTREATDMTRTDDLSETTDITRTDNLSHTDDHTRTDDLATTNDVTLTHSEKAYNSSGMVDTTEDVTDQDGTQTGTSRTAGEATDTGTVRNAGTVNNTGTVRDAGTVTNTFGNNSSSGESGDDSYENSHTYHGYGNIGIMSSQQLFRDEISTTSWSIYEAISDLFCEEFCIMIY